MNEIKINPLEGNPSLKGGVVAFLLLLVGIALTSGFLKVVLIMFFVLVSLFLVGVLYGRLSSKWRRLHYPLMVRYAKSAGMVQGIYEKQGKDFNVDEALSELLLSVFPQTSDYLLNKYLQNAYDWERNLSTGVLKAFFKKKIPNSSGAKLENIVTSFKKFFTDHIYSNKETNVNYIKTRLVISELVKEKYGKEEWLEYLYAVVMGQAT